MSLKQIDVVDKDSVFVLNQKPTSSHSEVETTVKKGINWFKYQKGAIGTQILLPCEIQEIVEQKVRISNRYGLLHQRKFMM